MTAVKLKSGQQYIIVNVYIPPSNSVHIDSDTKYIEILESIENDINSILLAL